MKKKINRKILVIFLSLSLVFGVVTPEALAIATDATEGFENSNFDEGEEQNNENKDGEIINEGGDESDKKEDTQGDDKQPVEENIEGGTQIPGDDTNVEGSTQTPGDGTNVEGGTQTPGDGTNVEGGTQTPGDGTNIEGGTQTPGDGTNIEGGTQTPGDGTNVEGGTQTPGDGTNVEGGTQTPGDGTKVEGGTQTPGDGTNVDGDIQTPDDGTNVDGGTQTPGDGTNIEGSEQTPGDDTCLDGGVYENQGVDADEACTCDTSDGVHNEECPQYEVSAEHEMTEVFTHIETCIDGCTGDNCECECHKICLYYRFMACSSLEEIEIVLSEASEEELLSLTEEELMEIEEYIVSLEPQPAPAIVVEEFEPPVLSEIVYPTVSYTNVAPFGDPVIGGVN